MRHYFPIQAILLSFLLSPAVHVLIVNFIILSLSINKAVGRGSSQMVSALEQLPWSWTLDRVLVLCSCTRHFTHIMPLSTQVNKWVAANLMLGVPCDGLASHTGGSRNTLSMLLHATESGDEGLPVGPLCSNTDFTHTISLILNRFTRHWVGRNGWWW